MTRTDESLPSWRPGPTRDALVGFLADAESVPTIDRVACFDNDGTLWCERPSLVQFDFFVDELTSRAEADPDISSSPEFAALLSGGNSAIGELGLERVALALTGLFEGVTAPAFAARAREFMDRAVHSALDRPLRGVVYQPMLELLDELRRREFTVAIVSGSGTEFVRAISPALYGVPPELVVGTLIGYEFTRDDQERPLLLRTARLSGDPNEGATKVTNIQTYLGRRPILAAGNSGGDREMLEWAAAADGPTLALLVDHDDAGREFEYVSAAATFAEPEPITEVGSRLGWTIVSMARDWTQVFPSMGT